MTMLVDRPLRRVALATLIAAGIATAAVGLAIFRELVLLVLLGLVFTELFQAIAEPLSERMGAPRGLALGLAVFLVLGALVGLFLLCLYPLLEQLGALLADTPRLARALGERSERLTRWLDGDRARASGADLAVGAALDDLAVGGGRAILAALDGLFRALAVVFLGVFVAATPRTHRAMFLALLPERVRPRGRRFLATARQGLRNWMVAVVLSMGIMGALVTGGLWLLGVPYFLVFGLFAGAMELVPYLGPVLAFMAPTALCLATDPPRAIGVGAFYLVVHALEANVVIPFVVRRRAHIPPSLVVLSILVFGSLAGIVGLIVATPVLTIVLAAVQEFWLAPREEEEEAPALRAAA